MSFFPTLTRRLALTLTPIVLSACASQAPGPAEVRSPSHFWGQTADSPPPAPVPPAAEPASAPRLVSTPVPEPALGRVADDLRPDASTVDFNAPEAHADLWARVRSQLRLEHLEGPRVEKWERHYGSRPDYVQRMMQRGGRYLFHIVEEVERRQLPMELALLPFIESAFNPEAMSRVKASGMWQFMSATGKDFDLKQNLFRDDRRDVLASTRAALDYLAQLGRRYDGNWPLALAAYNWGMGNVDRAIKRVRATGQEASYANLRMPGETADYVPKLQAIKNLLLDPARLGVSLPPLANHPYFLSVEIVRDIDVDLAARLAGLSTEVFRQFNPQMNKPVVLAAATPRLLLPYDNAALFVQQLAAYEGPLATWTAWQVPKTQLPAEAARAVGMSEAELRTVNRIPKGMRIQAGSTLLVPRSAKRNHDVSEHLADTAKLALQPEVQTRTRSIRARKGDTLASLARRHQLDARQLAQWNRLAVGVKLREGQSLKVVQVVAAGKPAKTPTKTQAKAQTKAQARSKAKAKTQRESAKPAQHRPAPPVSSRAG